MKDNCHVTKTKLVDVTPIIDYLSGGDEVKSLAESVHDQRFIEMLNKATRVDAVEVIRCKDCRHWNENMFWCNQHSYFDEDEWNMFYGYDFCSRGERKSEDER